MKIGDRVYVVGYIDEIRKDVIIIRNSSGYFGTGKQNVFIAENIKPQKEKHVERGLHLYPKRYKKIVFKENHTR